MSFFRLPYPTRNEGLVYMCTGRWYHTWKRRGNTRTHSKRFFNDSSLLIMGRQGIRLSRFNLQSSKDCARRDVHQIWKFLQLGEAGSFIQNSPVRTQLRFQFLIHRGRLQYIERAVHKCCAGCISTAKE